jgi:hypothetical protein
LGGNEIEIDYHLLLDLYHHTRLKGGNKSLKLHGYGISADLDWRENVPAVPPGVSGFRNRSPFIL